MTDLPESAFQDSISTRSPQAEGRVVVFAMPEGAELDKAARRVNRLTRARSSGCWTASAFADLDEGEALAGLARRGSPPRRCRW